MFAIAQKEMILTKNMAKADYDNSQASYNSCSNKILIIIGLGLFVAIALGLIISISISKQIKKV